MIEITAGVKKFKSNVATLNCSEFHHGIKPYLLPPRFVCGTRLDP